MSSVGRLRELMREHFWGLFLLVALVIVSGIAVRSWKIRHPGAMTVIESQAMDMTAMKPPEGAVPVATEVVHVGHFTAKVTYTGSVAPFQEQVIYPRVEGWLKDFNVYNGDTVASRQLIAVVDSPDLQSRAAGAAAGRAAAASEVPAAEFNVARMTAERAAAEGEVESARSELTRAKAMVAAAQKSVTQRQNEVKSAKANLDYWKAEIAREEKLLKAGAVSLQEFQSEQAQAAAAEAELGNKEAALEEAKANVEAAKADVGSKESMLRVAVRRASAADAALSAAWQEVRQRAAMARQAGAMAATAATIDQYRYIRAPFAGTVATRYVSPGQFVTPSTAIANVVQIDRVRLQANVSDMDLGRIRLGAPVTARFRKDPGLLVNARVTSISPLADQASRTAVVEALVPNPGHKLLPGDAVTLEIAVQESTDTITVPMSAIVQKEGAPAVWLVSAGEPGRKTLYTCTMHPEVISDRPGDCPKCHMKLVPKTNDGGKKAHLVTVTTGGADRDRTEVLYGLSRGDEVVYRGNTYLKEGDPVFPTAWTEDGPKEMPPAPGAGPMPGVDHSRMNMSGSSDSHSAVRKPRSEKTYVCPMHPHEMSHNPNDRCRLCGMKLVETKQ